MCCVRMSEKTVPQVLFLGNGLCRAFLGEKVAWKNLIKGATSNPAVPDNYESSLPAALEIILRTGNMVSEWAREHHRELYFCLDDSSGEFIDILKQLMTMGFDDILTANYSYELESASIFPQPLTDTRLKNMTDSFLSGKIRKAERKYLLHTFNRTVCDGVSNRIWHVHGEARKPDSMIIGHYYYGSLLNRYISFLKQRGNAYKTHQDNGVPLVQKSWIDSFIMGDVYVLGFGFDRSEMDLWWLLNRKFTEKADTGTLYFYQPKSRQFDEKTELMKVYGAEIVDCGFDYDEDMDFKPFYRKAIEDIRSRMSGL